MWEVPASYISTGNQTTEYISENAIMLATDKVRDIRRHSHLSPRLQDIFLNAIVFAQDQHFTTEARMQELIRAVLEYRKEQEE